MKFFSIDSPLMKLLDKLGSIMIVNLCFVVYSLPVVTIGASTAAMYRCFLTMANDGDSGLFRLFFNSFKQNFKKSTVLELICLPALLIVSFEVVVYLSGAMGEDTLRAILFYLPFVMICCIISYIFPLQAQFENTVKGTLKNSALLAITHLPVTLLVTAFNLVFPFLLYFQPELFLKSLMLWILFGFGLVGYINTYFLRQVFIRYMPETEEEAEDTTEEEE